MLGGKTLRYVLVTVGAVALVWLTPVHAQAACQAGASLKRDLSISRTITIDASQGRLYGSMTLAA